MNTLQSTLLPAGLLGLWPLREKTVCTKLVVCQGDNAGQEEPSHSALKISMMP